MLSRVFLYLAALAVSAVLATTAFAQGLTLTPAAVPLQGSTGQSVTQTLTLRNDSDQPLDFRLEAQDVVVRDGARVFVEAGTLSDSIAASAVFVPQQVNIPAHASASVKVTLTLPHAMHHRAVVALFKGQTIVQAGQRPALLSVGTLFTFTVSDRISIAEEAFVATPPSSRANARLQAALLNDGDEPVILNGVAAILNAEGRLMGKMNFPRHRLLPRERATLATEYPGELPPGNYKVVATFDLGKQAKILTETLVVK